MNIDMTIAVALYTAHKRYALYFIYICARVNNKQQTYALRLVLQ